MKGLCFCALCCALYMCIKFAVSNKTVICLLNEAVVFWVMNLCFCVLYLVVRLYSCISRLHCSLILEGSCPCPPVSQCLTPQRGNQDDPRLPLRFTCSSPPYFFFSRHLTKKWFFDKARKDSDKTMPKTQRTQSLAYFDSINTFLSKQRLLQSLKSWASFSLVLFGNRQEMGVT